MMTCTSAEASKLLRTLTDEYRNLLDRERSMSAFCAFANEDLQTIRPDYDYARCQQQLAGIEKKIRTIKHALNLFNLTTELPGMDGMTIDQALVCLPQLTTRKQKLGNMARRLEKTRLTSNRTTTQAVSEFEYANYDVEVAKQDYAATVAQIAALQNALAVVNTTKAFPVPDLD